MRLTKDAIERAKPPEPGRKERFLRDDEVRGLGVRITASGAKSFIFEARIKGRPRRLTIGPWPEITVALARQQAREKRVAIARGGDPHAAHLADKREATFGELADRYMSNMPSCIRSPARSLTTNITSRTTFRADGKRGACRISDALISNAFTSREIWG
jgi:hypothetical protein